MKSYKTYKKRALVIKLIKKGKLSCKSYQIVVRRKQSKSNSRLLQLGRIDLAKNSNHRGALHILKLDKKRFCNLLSTRRVSVSGDVLQYFLPEIFFLASPYNQKKR